LAGASIIHQIWPLLAVRRVGRTRYLLLLREALDIEMFARSLSLRDSNDVYHNEAVTNGRNVCSKRKASRLAMRT
jgi:hypothetical protein